MTQKTLPKVQLISDITVTPISSVGGDHMVAAAARVSTSGQIAKELADHERSDEIKGLINFLMKHRHGTPFEHASMTFFVHAPIFVWREWHRHRIGFSFNEESGRYKKLDPVFWVPRNDRSSIKSKDFVPARPKFEVPSEAMHLKTSWWMADSYQIAYNTYINMLNEGYSTECARAVLPVGIYSSCWVTCNPRSLMHFLSLRVHDSEAQYISYPQVEIQEAAVQCEEFLKAGWPFTYECFITNKRVAP